MISLQDIEKLIEIAKKQGVTSLTVGEFSVSFEKKEEESTSAIGFEIEKKEDQ